jgi:hypothetical protein
LSLADARATVRIPLDGAEGYDADTKVLRAGSLIVVGNKGGAGIDRAFQDYVVFGIGGKTLAVDGLETDRYDMGEPFAGRFEAVIDGSDTVKTYGFGAQGIADALAYVRSNVGNYSTSGDEDDSPGVSSEVEPETSDAGEPATSVAGSAKPSASAYVPKTGYYKDSGGYAWYYNDAQDYLEAIAAPKGKYTTQPRFSKSSGGGDYAKMKGILIAANATDRASAIKNATASGGEALPASRSSAPAAPVPNEVANRGAAQTSKKKGVPAWVWWTSGTVVVAGLGVWGATSLKKRKAEQE